MKNARTAVRTALEELTGQEKADLLDRLLAAQPQLRAQAEAGIDELSGRAPGWASMLPGS